MKTIPSLHRGGVRAGGEMIKRKEGVSASKGKEIYTFFSDFIRMNISRVPKVITGLKG